MEGEVTRCERIEDDGMTWEIAGTMEDGKMGTTRSVVRVGKAMKEM
jgi:hypothetical protein